MCLFRGTSYFLSWLDANDGNALVKTKNISIAEFEGLMVS